MFVALTYLRSGEYPELIRLRVDMLAEGGLLLYSLNLCNWCLQSPSFQDDISLRLTQLLLLHKLSRQEEFHNQVSVLVSYLFSNVGASICGVLH